MAIISNGELILEGVPAQTIEAVKGRIWSKVVTSEAERDAIEKGFHVVSAHMVGGLNEVRIYSEAAPGHGFAQTDADLEDVYFFNLTRHQKN